ncbi:MAG: hypothetical protein Q9182_007165 [Xanthomendoza sp. 2 TL-2023]
MPTRSTQHSHWVELCVLVQRDLEHGMGVAEDVAAMAAMVAALDEVEFLLAGWGVADEGMGVGFPVRFGRGCGDGGKGGFVFVCIIVWVAGVEFRSTGVIGDGGRGRGGDRICVVFGDLVQCDALSRRSGGAPAHGTAIPALGVDEAVGAAVEAPRRSKRGGALRAFGRAQRSGNIHGGLWGAELATSQGEGGEAGWMVGG